MDTQNSESSLNVEAVLEITANLLGQITGAFEGRHECSGPNCPGDSMYYLLSDLRDEATLLLWRGVDFGAMIALEALASPPQEALVNIRKHVATFEGEVWRIAKRHTKEAT